MEKKFIGELKNSNVITGGVAEIQKNTDKKKETAIRIMGEVLAELKINPNELGTILGKNRSQAIYDVLDPNKKVGISFKMADSICEKFPQFNKCYLLAGEGELLKSDNINQRLENTSNSIAIGRDANGSEIHIVIQNLDKFVQVTEKYQEQMDRLLAVIENLVKNK